ncbi:hypothetical protein BJY04DRAFT_197850 [Aspergillus karnatakaensis]|uniref:uncharacterized protein n=1 Tax=Aspergillus karnatakaensis TaxID=1810916 RepID=UPI003CCD15C4
MNNDQFRRLLINNSTSKPKGTSPTGHPSSTSPGSNGTNTRGQSPGGPGSNGPGHALGSRMRSSIPMTPRTLTAPNFARQLADHHAASNPPPNKKFKSSAAPKGTKLPAGYEDRAARLREAEAEAENEAQAKNAAQLKVLEERFKKGVITEEVFLRGRRELGVGGDLGSTHMVKGLDWDLLKRVRAGEDLGSVEEGSMEDGKEEATPREGEDEGDDKVMDVDEEFDKVLDEKGDAVLPSAPKEKEKKKGSMAPPPAPVQRKTRDEILKELKASRAAAAAAEAAPEPALGARFKKFGDSKVEKKRFIEQDESGRRREVLLITDAEGKTKRKTRWLDKPGTTAPTAPSAPTKQAKPLGMEVPAEIAARIKASQAVEEEDDDIFAGVGADYDPLGDAGSDEDSSDSEEEGEVATKAPKQAPAQEATDASAKPRNYFGTPATEEKVEDRSNPLAKDPTLLAAFKRAAALRQASSEDVPEGDDESVDRETLLHRKKFLEEARRREALDAADMDYGFGGSRNEDDEDDEAVLLQQERGGTKRKRGPKKKKGDKDSASDVLRVLEGRKKD